MFKAKLWLWLGLFVPLCAGMFYAQRQLFPATAHLELPGVRSSNVWVEAFVWARDHTPVKAYFALDPEHMRLHGEDQHGFRAIAERSMLADAAKDSGAVTMFPALAATWLEQVNAQAHWKTFILADFLNLDAHTVARRRQQLLDHDVASGRTRRQGGGRIPTEKKRPK